MGLYGALRPEHASVEQLIATMVKVPLLFLVTLAVTFPSLYVFSTLAGARLEFFHSLRLILAVIAVTSTVLASFGPITGFFTLSTESYGFMIVLNVVFFTVAGFVGLGFLDTALRTVFRKTSAEPAPPPPPVDLSGSLPPPIPRYAPRPSAERLPKTVLRIWTLIYGVVGAQTGWILRPFIGAPDQPFSWFRERDSNFFEAFAGVLRDLFP